MAPPTKRFTVPSNSSYPNASIKISKYVPLRRPVLLTTKEVHYFSENDNIYLKDEPIARKYRTIIHQTTDCEFEIGELVWSQDGDSPFWPAMVAANPARGLFHWFSDNDEFVFVQYFGREPSLGWVKPDKIIPYLGYGRVPLQLCQYHRQSRRQCSILNTKTVLESMFIASEEDWPDWNHEVAEAEAAIKLSTNERIELLSFDYKWHSDGVQVGSKVNYKRMWYPKEATATPTNSPLLSYLQQQTDSAYPSGTATVNDKALLPSMGSLMATNSQTSTVHNRPYHFATTPKVFSTTIIKPLLSPFGADSTYLANRPNESSHTLAHCQPSYDFDDNRGSEFYERAAHSGQSRKDEVPWIGPSDLTIHSDPNLTNATKLMVNLISQKQEKTILELRQKYEQVSKLNAKLKEEVKDIATSSTASGTTTEASIASQEAGPSTSASAAVASAPKESTQTSGTTEVEMHEMEVAMALLQLSEGRDFCGDYVVIAPTTEHVQSEWELQMSLQDAASKDEPMETDNTSENGDTEE